ncbi:MAG: AraC family transcriptional regulator ligand-binding domain-containing protein, partial [Limnobacter sp.]
MPARRTVVSVKILSELGIRLGSTRSALLTGSSILPAQLDDPYLEIDPDQELQVIHNLVRLHGKVPGLGLMAGSEYHLTTYGIWGYALITSPTFRQAVELGLRYLDLTFAFSKIELTLSNGLASMVLSVDHLPPA